MIRTVREGETREMVERSMSKDSQGEEEKKEQSSEGETHDGSTLSIHTTRMIKYKPMKGDWEGVTVAQWRDRHSEPTGNTINTSDYEIGLISTIGSIHIRMNGSGYYGRINVRKM